MFENRVMRIFGPKRDEITEEWIKLHNEELDDLYSSTNIIRVVKSIRMRWAGHVACMVERRGAYKVLLRKPEVKRPLESPRHRWGNNIKWDGRAWTGLMWLGTLVNAVINLRLHKMWGLSWLAENRSAYHEVLCSME